MSSVIENLFYLKNYNFVSMQVTCAIIIQNKSVLLAQRASGQERAGQWEFPGGKIHPGEGAEECIQREIMEELGVAVSILLRGPAVHHSYPDKSISLIPFICTIESGTPRALVHEALEWIQYDCLNSDDMCTADRQILDWFLTVAHHFCLKKLFLRRGDFRNFE